ncbi:hypothetical protein FRC00_004793 [Tulasnella sp. 408]|nr:hypothetical protein FRC00_004793 [Tulasnella sp. 408]
MLGLSATRASENYVVESVVAGQESTSAGGGETLNMSVQCYQKERKEPKDQMELYDVQNTEAGDDDSLKVNSQARPKSNKLFAILLRKGKEKVREFAKATLEPDKTESLLTIKGNGRRIITYHEAVT